MPKSTRSSSGSCAAKATKRSKCGLLGCNKVICTRSPSSAASLVSMFMLLLPSLLLLLLLLLLLSLVPLAAAQRDYKFAEMRPCTLSSNQIRGLGPTDDIEPCVIADIRPDPYVEVPTNRTATITLVQVTPSLCANHRDGAVTGADFLNSDNDGKGVAVGFNQDFFVRFHFVGVVVGNAAFLSEDEYGRRHQQILSSMIQTLDAQYIVGSCSFAAALDKQPALDHKTIVMSQVGPPGFYTDNNPWVFGFHINSDTYPLPNVQELDFYSDTIPGGKDSVPVRVIYRTKSEFFYSTCNSAIQKLTSLGFTDLETYLYDHADDHDGDGESNAFDQDFLEDIADKACPPRSGETGFHPALFVCSLTEQDILINRWRQNGCRPVSTWLTASTWVWAGSNPSLVPYFQGGGQWHKALRYSDRFFETGFDLIEYNKVKFGYEGNYDQVVSYAIPVLYSQHLQATYRVQDNPDPLADFADPSRREQLRRDMVILNVDTIFGPVSFNANQRNIGRGAAGTQWLPINEDGSFANALVSPFLQAEAAVQLPSESALPCDPGNFVNQTEWYETGSILAGGCNLCPADTFTNVGSSANSCRACPAGSTTEGNSGQTFCTIYEQNLLPIGILIFGYFAVAIVWALSLYFIFWLIKFRTDPVVRIAQLEFLLLICVGAILSTSTIVSLSFQAADDEDTSTASAGCTAAPFLYTVGWVLQYASLSAKSYRLYSIMRNNEAMKRVTVTASQMAYIIIISLAIDMAIVVTWTILSPLVYERSEIGTSVDEELGLVVVQSVGKCVMQNENYSFWYFAGPLVGHHAILMVGTNVLLYQVRNVAERYQEQKYVALASVLVFEVLVVGLPVLIAIKDSSVATFIVLSGIIAMGDIGILGFIFIPKVMFQRKGLEEGVGVGESILRESHRRASTRESARRESSFISTASALPMKSSNVWLSSAESIPEGSHEDDSTSDFASRSDKEHSQQEQAAATPQQFSTGDLESNNNDNHNVEQNMRNGEGSSSTGENELSTTTEALTNLHTDSEDSDDNNYGSPDKGGQTTTQHQPASYAESSGHDSNSAFSNPHLPPSSPSTPRKEADAPPFTRVDSGDSGTKTSAREKKRMMELRLRESQAKLQGSETSDE